VSPKPRPFSMRVANRAVHELRPRNSKADPLLLRLQRLFRLATELQSPASARAALAEVSHIRVQLRNRRMFLMRKTGVEFPDSRQAAGLRGDVTIDGLKVETGQKTTKISGTATVTNTGQNRWLPSNAGRGAVLLGLRLRHGRHPSDDHGRVWFPGEAMVNPGDTVVLPFATDVDTPTAGSDPVVLEVDLVSEGMCWFAEVAGHPIEVPVPPLTGS
jgi:hypothetical protein